MNKGLLIILLVFSILIIGCENDEAGKPAIILSAEPIPKASSSKKSPRTRT